MHTITARNVNNALDLGVRFLREHGVHRDSRNGPVLVAPTPVTTEYEKPRERVLFSAERDANPFFHLVEALWMLAGRDDLATLTKYVPRLAEYSDDGGKTQPGAYGKRWRDWFSDGRYAASPIDQLRWVIKRLRADPNDRRCVVQMWDANTDPGRADDGGRDVPCNLILAPWVDVRGRLSMTVFCRSNDIVWGAYGANAVHFSVLQEYLAHGVGVPLGKMWQVSNNYHAYLATIDKVPETYTRAESSEYDGLYPAPMFSKGDSLQHFDEDLTIFFDEPGAVGLRSAFLRQVAAPMVLAHQAYRNKRDPERFTKALEIIEQCRGADWRRAGAEWLRRREAATKRAQDEGPSHD